MSQWKKLIDKILSMNKDMRFDELKKVLEFYGYHVKPPKGGGSHYTFRKKGKPPITIPKNEPIKVTYIELVKAVVEEDANEDNQ